MPAQPPHKPTSRQRQASLALLAAGSLLPAAAPASVPEQRQALQARVAAVRSALAETGAAAEAGELPASRLLAQAANWTNWPKWTKWSNWANK